MSQLRYNHNLNIVKFLPLTANMTIVKFDCIFFFKYVAGYVYIRANTPINTDKGEEEDVCHYARFFFCSSHHPFRY